MTKILITGGAGYIGSVLTPLLLENRFQVRVLDTLMYNGGSMLAHFRNPLFDFVKGDIRDPQAVKKAVEGCDIVIHLAAIVGFPACRKNPELSQTINVDGTRVVGEAAGKSRLVLYGSTGSNYGALTDKVCTEETPLNPLSIYGKTKTAAEQHLMENNKAIAYRFATAFGVSPRMRLDLLVNEFVHTALKQRYLVVYESQFMRTFIHVHDIARSFLFAIQNADRMFGQVYNVGTEKMNYSKAAVCQMIKDKIDYYLHYAAVGEDADKRNYVVSYEKLAKLGFRTTITLEDGISELIRACETLDFKTPYANV